MHLIDCPDQMSIISLNFLLRRHVLRLHFLFSYYWLFTFLLPPVKVFASYFFSFLRQNDKQWRKQPLECFLKYVFLKVDKILENSPWGFYEFCWNQKLLLFNFSKFMNRHFQGARFGGCFHYQLLIVNMIQRRFQNISMNTWRRNIHFFNIHIHYTYTSQ